MLLRGLKVKGASFSHYLRGQNLPEKLERPEADVLRDLRNKPSQIIRDEAALGYIRLALQIAGRYVCALNRPDKADVLVSAAVFAVVDAVDRVVKGELKHDNLGGFIVEKIHFGISAELENEVMFGSAARTKRWRRQKGIENEVIKQEALSEDLGTNNSEIEIFEINEALESLGLSDLERQIIELRVQGFRDDYIGEIVGLSQPSVWMIRRDIQTRYLGATVHEKASAQ